jgi:hypothetical protein
MIEELKSVKVMFDRFDDLSLGFVPTQIDEVVEKVNQLEKLDVKGKEEEISSALTPLEAQAIIKAYCFTTIHNKHKFLFLRKK